MMLYPDVGVDGEDRNVLYVMIHCLSIACRVFIIWYMYAKERSTRYMKNTKRRDRGFLDMSSLMEVRCEGGGALLSSTKFKMNDH